MQHKRTLNSQKKKMAKHNRSKFFYILTIFVICASLKQLASASDKETSSSTRSTLSTNQTLGEAPPKLVPGEQMGANSTETVPSEPGERAGELAAPSSGGELAEELDELEQAGADLKLLNVEQAKLERRRFDNWTTNSTQRGAEGQRLASAVAARWHNRTECLHKGRVYREGQPVAIEEQPCLSCSCRMAILQCFLRVCPPVVSLEAHRRKLLQADQDQPSNGAPASPAASSTSCLMVREPGQCCPVMRCQTGAPAELAASQLEPRTGAPTLPAASNNSAAAAAAPEELERAASAQTGRLSVVGGPAGQPDSILLISSNPQALLQQQQQQLQGRQLAHSNASASMQGATSGELAAAPSSLQLSGAPPEAAAPAEVGAAGQSAALLEALLETIYSNAAAQQLSGLNLQGACLLNGSLYFEGSAVIAPPQLRGNGQTGASGGGQAHHQACQYCYCIRQKVMCVRPRCQLIISGCTPKYSDQYACCPTSYSCAASPSNSLLPPAHLLPGGGAGSSAVGGVRSAGAPSSLAARLSLLVEQALARLAAKPASSPSSAQLELTLRQADGGEQAVARQTTSAMKQSEQDGAAAYVASMLGALLLSQENATSATGQPEGRPPLGRPASSAFSAPEVPPPASGKASSLGGASLAVQTVSGGNATTTAAGKPQRPRQTHKSAQTGQTTGASGEQQQEPVRDRPPAGTTERPSSVADFLEPMNRLGPHVSGPSGAGGCLENGRTYAIGEQIPTLESCKHCYCGLEGTKECKMVECTLQAAHNCRPITPEGHCCPIRFECPSSSETGGSDEPANLEQSHELGGPNGCSATGGANCPVVASYENSVSQLVKSTRLVQDNQAAQPPQDNQSHSLTEELSHFIMQIKANASATAEPHTQQQQLEDTSGGSAGSTGSSGKAANVTTTTSSDSATLGGQLATEAPLRQRLDYHSVQPTAAQQQPPTIPAGLVGIPSIEPEVASPQQRQQENGTSEPPSSPADDHFEAPPSVSPFGGPSVNEQTTGRELSDINTTRGASSDDQQPAGRGQEVEARPVGNQRDLRSTTNGHMPAGELTAPPSGQPNASAEWAPHAGQISPAAPLGHFRYSVGEPSGQPQPVGGPTSAANQSEVVPSLPLPLGQPQNASDELVLDEYLAGGPPEQSGAGREPALPRLRMMQMGVAPSPDRAHAGLQQAAGPGWHNGSQGGTVVFDDELSSTGNNVGLGANNTINGNNNNGNTDSDSVAWSAQPEGNGTISGESPPTTATPWQATTGTPLGLSAADRQASGLDNGGWLKPLPNWIRSFGQRLSGQPAERPEAAGGAQWSPGGAGNSAAAASGRSLDEQGARASSPLLSILRSLVAAGPNLPAASGGPQSAGELEAAPRSARLVMRPLETVTNVAPPRSQSLFQPPTVLANNHRARALASARPPTSPSSSSSLAPVEPLEIVTAPVPHEPEVFGGAPVERNLKQQLGGESSRELVVVASSSFARRSDAGPEVDGGEPGDSASEQTAWPSTGGRSGRQSDAGDQTVRYFSSVSSASMASLPRPQLEHRFGALREGNSPPAGQFPAQLPAETRSAARPQLTCFDQLTNRTYQQNEHIANLEEPCKSCTCVLGKQLCSTLVCPQKPAADCKEERRPGHCCPSYLCSNRVSSNQLLGPADQEQPLATLQPSSVEIPSPSLPGLPNLPNLPSLQPKLEAHKQHSRMMHQQAQQAQLSQQAQQMQPRLGLPSQRAIVLSEHQGGQQAAGGQAAGGASLVASGGAQSVSSWLPPKPVRLADLASILPPHLRFRAPSGPQLASEGRSFGERQPGGNGAPISAEQNNDLQASLRRQAGQLGQQQAGQQQAWRPHSKLQLLGSSLVRPPVLMHPGHQQQSQLAAGPLGSSSQLPLQTNRINTPPKSVAEQQQQQAPTLRRRDDLLTNQISLTAPAGLSATSASAPGQPKPLNGAQPQTVAHSPLQALQQAALWQASNLVGVHQSLNKSAHGQPAAKLEPDALARAAHPPKAAAFSAQVAPPTSGPHFVPVVLSSSRTEFGPTAFRSNWAQPEKPPSSHNRPEVGLVTTNSLLSQQQRQQQGQRPPASTLIASSEAPTVPNAELPHSATSLSSSSSSSSSSSTASIQPDLRPVSEPPTRRPPEPASTASASARASETPELQRRRVGDQGAILGVTTVSSSAPTTTTTTTTTTTVDETTTVSTTTIAPTASDWSTMATRSHSSSSHSSSSPQQQRESSETQSPPTSPNDRLTVQPTEGPLHSSTSTLDGGTLSEVSSSVAQFSSAPELATTERSSTSETGEPATVGGSKGARIPLESSPDGRETDAGNIGGSSDGNQSSASTRDGPQSQIGDTMDGNSASSASPSATSESSSSSSAEELEETVSDGAAPLDLFRVSECNIYGQVYKVGRLIERLSDQCKQCHCTPNGVDCKQIKC